MLQRSKIGFDIPAHEWLRGPLRPMLLETIQKASAEHGEFFDSAAIDNSRAMHLERRANYGYHLWGLMVLFLWMKAMADSNVASPARTVSRRKAFLPLSSVVLW